jgi:para-nitrobenzyl esterase
MTSPLSKGLFRRAIGESGSVILAGDPLALSQAEKVGEKFSAGWNLLTGASIKDMRAVSAGDILKAGPDYLTPGTYMPNDGIAIDGYVFPKKPAAVFEAGQEHRVALLHGNNARERLEREPPSDLKKAVEETYGPIAGRAQALYVGGTDPLYGTPADQWATDTSFRCAAVAQVAWHAAAGNPAFEYQFSRIPDGKEASGTTHAMEVSYVFGTLDQGISGLGEPRVRPTSVDTQISELMQQYWTNFAKTGNPNGRQLPPWPKFNALSRAYIQFTDSGPIAKEGLRRPFCDLFVENVKRLNAP